MRLIDAEALIKDLSDLKKSPWANDQDISADRRFGISEALDMIKSIVRCDQPTVDAVPVRHGRWEKVRGHQMVRRCSECGDIMPRDRAFIHYIYCGHCGARMDKDETY